MLTVFFFFIFFYYFFSSLFPTFPHPLPFRFSSLREKKIEKGQKQTAETFIQSQNIVDPMGHLRFDLVSHDLENQSLLHKKSLLLDQMSVPNLTRHCQLSSPDGKISTAPKEILKTAFLRLVSPSSFESNDEEQDDGFSSSSHSDVISTLKELKELNSDEIQAILSHFTNVSNDTSSLSQMSKELINSHIFRGFGFPDREIFLRVLNQAQKTSCVVGRKVIPFPQTAELLTNNAIGIDTLAYFDPSVYFAQLKIDLEKMDADGNATEREKTKNTEKKKAKKQKISAAFLLREKEIRHKVKRNMRAQEVRRFHNVKSLKHYAKSKRPFLIRNLSLFKLNKIKKFFETCKGKYDFAF